MPFAARTPTARAALVLADRATARPAFVALSAAIEASPLAARVTLDLVRGPGPIAEAVGAAQARGEVAVAAWSFFSTEVGEVAAELAAVRAWPARPDLLLAGGVHATAEPAATLALGFDLAARGEGERTIVGVLAALLDGQDPRAVPGLAWHVHAARGGGTGAGAGGRAGACAPGRDLPGPIAESGRAAPVELDAAPSFSRRLRKALWLEVTRGCVWACRFCQTPFLHRARFRHRGLDAVRAHVRFAVGLGQRDLRFLTPSALSYGAEGDEVRLEAVEALLATAREELGPDRRLFFGTFPSELRPEHVSPHALALIRRYADNREVLLGAQSGSDRQLAAMRRGHGVEEVVRAVRLAREAGFTPAVDFILGLPGETADDLACTREVMAGLAGEGARVHGHAFLPLPGTPWRDAPPGRIDGPTAALLDRLASEGRAYGQWRRQERVAEALAARRRAAPRPA